MPKNSKPLTLLVADELMDSPEVQELVRKGHIIWAYGEPYKLTYDKDGLVLTSEQQPHAGVYDLIIGPNAQLMTKEHIRYLNEAIKRTRKLKYGGKDESID